MIKFSQPGVGRLELEYLKTLLAGDRFAGAGKFTQSCATWIQTSTGAPLALMTSSCTDALEMSALLLNVGPGDEVIMPSFTFVSTANAFALRGAKIVFVDIDPQTMNVDASQIEAAITPQTRALVVIHYAGVGCDMEAIAAIAAKYNVPVVEDAAQAICANYRGRPLGSFGALACFSFHETKNIHCGEGGALVINDPALVERAQILYEKGTNRSKFLLGQVDKYTWVDLGSSFLMSEFQAAFLLGQLEQSQEITQERMGIWHRYHQSLEELESLGALVRPCIPDYCEHNGHIYFVKLADASIRNRIIDFLKSRSIQGTFHYVPLHSAPAGAKFGRFHGQDRHTTRESGRLLRLPLWRGLPDADVSNVVESLQAFFGDQD